MSVADTPSNRDAGEPHTVADQLIVERNRVTKTHRGDFRIYYDGFDFVTFVDRSIPLRKRDEAMVVDDETVVGHGIIADVRQYDRETEFYAVPLMENISLT